MLALRPARFIAPSSTFSGYGQIAPWASPPPPEPVQAKPSLWDWYKTLQEPKPAGPVESAVTGLRHNAEGMAVGGVLGFIDGEFGLDFKGKYPIDGILALFFYLWSIRDAGKPEGSAADLRAISQSCSTVLTYRKTKDWRETANGKQDAKSSPRNTDPIIAAGEAIGVKVPK